MIGCLFLAVFVAGFEAGIENRFRPPADFGSIASVLLPQAIAAIVPFFFSLYVLLERRHTLVRCLGAGFATGILVGLLASWYQASISLA